MNSVLEAILNDNTDYFLNFHENINQVIDDNGNTPLMIASDKGKINILKLIIKIKPDFDVFDDVLDIEGNTTAKIITTRVVLNATNIDGWTSLMFASNSGHKDIVKTLLKTTIIIGGSIHKKGFTMMSGSRRFVKTDINIINKYGKTALILAVLNGHEEIVNALIKSHANVNIKDQNGKSALSYAKDKGNENIIRLLNRVKAI